MKINNRRYIGCKTKLVNYIFDTISQYKFSERMKFADLFAGTGVVSYKFAENGYDIILNDNLYSNFIVYKAVFGKETIRKEKLLKIIEKLNKIESKHIEKNYFSNIYGDKYFSFNDAKKIGYIRDYIENIKKDLNDREYFLLISSLMYFVDKIANTVGHFESYLNSKPNDKNFELKLLDTLESKNNIKIYNMDANILAKNIKSDIVYIDPPYNARQYVNFYHVLENLCRWEKPTEFQGKSMKFKRDHLKSDYCRKKAPKLFEDLINSLDCKLIVVSYNNTYEAKSIASINTITSNQILEILNKKGKVKIKGIDYKAFNSGKTTLKNHKEILYICEIQNEN